jgi:hypothetical protein
MCERDPPVLQYAPAARHRRFLTFELLAAVAPVLFLGAFLVCALLPPKAAAGMGILLALCIAGPILILILLIWSTVHARQQRKPVLLLRGLAVTAPLALLWIIALQCYITHRREIEFIRHSIQQQQLQSLPSQQAQPNP